ncbi:ZIP family metal transporter [Erythrobacter sp. CCH5-A1]|jgi:ZIP family zinc transporter|uniref:ZIP family metal transporter n=1 Tax=Erythrobacter sp. CCH5-A1 TaxID=1768792 RepID=UPI00082EF57C|nr:ZIP family metal transporter [Erythrobacter sp. CCH5-A1]
MADAALTGIAASTLAGAMTGLGGVFVAASGAPEARRQNLLIGFAAGVMIAAAFASLILPAFAQLRGHGASLVAAGVSVGIALWLGAAVMAWLRVWSDALAAQGRFWPAAPDERRIALFVLAITLHNLPEGMAVGLSFMGGDPQLGWGTMLAIGLQNIPEGLAVAALLASLGWSRTRCAAGALATGLIEPVGAAFGVAIAGSSAAVLPYALGFAAGAMLFVVAAEIIPHTRRQMAHGSASPALMAGLALMLALDLTLS